MNPQDAPEFLRRLKRQSGFAKCYPKSVSNVMEGRAAIERSTVFFDRVPFLPGLGERIGERRLLVREFPACGRVESVSTGAGELARAACVLLGLIVVATSFEQTGQSEECLHVRWVDANGRTQTFDRRLYVIAPFVQDAEPVVNVGVFETVLGQPLETLECGPIIALFECTLAAQEDFAIICRRPRVFDRRRASAVAAEAFVDSSLGVRFRDLWRLLNVQFESPNSAIPRCR